MTDVIAFLAIVVCCLIVREHRREVAAMQPLVLLPLTPTDPDAADESVARVVGWADPFETTRREIAALETTEETA